MAATTTAAAAAAVAAMAYDRDGTRKRESERAEWNGT